MCLSRMSLFIFFKGFIALSHQVFKKFKGKTLTSTQSSTCLFICERRAWTQPVSCSNWKQKTLLLTFGHFNSNLSSSSFFSSSLSLSVSGQIRRYVLEPNISPLGFLNTGNLLLPLSVAHSLRLSLFALCLSFVSLPAVVCDVKIVVELRWQRERDPRWRLGDNWITTGYFTDSDRSFSFFHPIECWTWITISAVFPAAENCWYVLI